MKKGIFRDALFSLFADFITCPNLVIVEKGFMQFEYASIIALVAVSLACTFSSVTALPRPDQVDNPDNLKYIVPDPVVLSGIVVDNTQAILVGKWKHSVHTPPFVGESYIHDMKELKGEKSATFIPNLPYAGRYEVRMSHNSNIRRANAVPVKIRHVGGETNLKINEGEPAPIQKLFRSLGTFEFEKGRSASVTIGTAGTDGKYVIVDSVQFIPLLDNLENSPWKKVLPEAVTSFGACREGDHLYVYGGHKGQAHVYSLDSHSKSFARIDIQNPNSWELLPFNRPLQGFGMASFNGKIYISGGSQATNSSGEKSNLTSVREVSAFDPEKKKWSQLPPLPEPRSSHEMVAHAGHLYIVGGWNMKDGAGLKWHRHGLFADLSKKPLNWEKLPETKWTVRANTAAVNGGQLYVIGGLTPKGMTNAVHKLDLETLQWSEGPEYPGTGHLKAFGAAACQVGDKLIVSAYSHQPRVLTETGWAPTSRKLEERRFFHRIIPLGSKKALFMGGANHDGHLNTLEVHELNPSD